MAWTAPSTFVAGAILTAAQLNTNVRDNTLAGGPIYATTAARDAAITAPFTGQRAFISGTNVNTQYNGTAWVSPQALSVPPMASVFRSAALSQTSTGAYQAVSFDTQEFTNTNSMWTITSPTRITLNTAGVYMVTGGATFVANATGLRVPAIYRSGSPYAFGTLVPGNTVVNMLNVTAVVESDGTHYVELFAYQDSGASLAYTVGAANMRFGATFIGKKA